MSKDKRKGGVTRFNVGSDETEIKYNGEVYLLTGKERDEFIDILVNICQQEGAERTINTDNIEYDILLDFKNDHKAKISSKEKLLDLGYEVDVISDENMGKVMKYIK